VFVLPYAVRSRLARNTIWAVLGAVLSQGSSLVAAFLLGRTLGLSAFGQLAFIQATLLMLGNLGEGGLTLTTTKFAGQWRTSDPERAGRLVGWSLQVTAVSAALMVMLLLAIEPYITRPGSPSLTKGLVAGGGLLAFDMLNRVQLGALAGLEAFRSSVRIHFWRGLFLVPGVWLGAWFGGLPGAVMAMGGGSLASFAIGHAVLRKECVARAIPLRYRGSLEAGVAGTSLRLWTSALLMTGSTWIVTVILSQQPSGFAELGLFNAAERWKTALLFLPNVLFQVVLPMLSHRQATGDRRSCRRIVGATLGLAFAVTGLAALLVWSLSPVLMSGFGQAFAQGSGLLSLAALSAVVVAVYTVGSGALWALGKPAHMLGIDVVKTSLLLGLCVAGATRSAWNLMSAYLFSFSAACVILLLCLHAQLRTEGNDAGSCR
jgi:O-antigen/teichoic acid export membrane protein